AASALTVGGRRGGAAAASAPARAAAVETDEELHDTLTVASKICSGEREFHSGVLPGTGLPSYRPPALVPAAVTALAEALSDPCPNDRLIAAALLSRAEPEDAAAALPELASALEDPDPQVRDEVVRTLASMK